MEGDHFSTYPCFYEVLHSKLLKDKQLTYIAVCFIVEVDVHSKHMSVQCTFGRGVSINRGAEAVLHLAPRKVKCCTCGCCTTHLDPRPSNAMTSSAARMLVAMESSRPLHQKGDTDLLASVQPPK